MNGQEKFLAAFEQGGTPEFARMMPYGLIVLRDFWDRVIGFPWYEQFDLDINTFLRWRKKYSEAFPQCLMEIYPGEPRGTTSKVFGNYMEWTYPDGRVHRINKPFVGGDFHYKVPEKIPTLEQVEAHFTQYIMTPEKFLSAGYADQPLAAKKAFGQERVMKGHLSSTAWRLLSFLSPEHFFMLLHDNREFIKKALELSWLQTEWEIERVQMTGAEVIWLEECMADMISPADYRELFVPYLQRMTEILRSKNIRSIHYFCGKPDQHLEDIMKIGSDAVSFEEGKKNFGNDIMSLAEYIDGRKVLLGNLDAYSVLEIGNDDVLRQAMEYQKQAGKRNKNRFVYSIGSPPTPDTTPERLYNYFARDF